MKTEEKAKKMSMDIVKQDDNELKKVVGGRDQMKRRGYYPGCPCPDCGTILEETGRMSREYYVSKCPKCGQEWLWYWE